MTAPRLREKARAGALALLPVGAIEQHGPHLPTGVDTLLAHEVALRIADLLDPIPGAVVAAAVPWGLSTHHMHFGGTQTLSLGTYRALLRDICGSILRAGFQRIAIVNGHGGNISALSAILTELADELPGAIAVTTYVNATPDEFARILDRQSGIMHACEGETSMMLAAHRDLVVTERLVDAHGPDCALLSDPVPVSLWRSFEEITATGVAGDARSATAEKGERMLAACSRRLAEELADERTWTRSRHIVAEDVEATSGGTR
ncbi:MAG: creatininase family protein [Mycolicibacterium neoaurum]|uniref:creatininase family protein n=1 Tax=Mycolicibacterium neoaurum TaxID=1795 RepID=UPI002FF621FB